MPMTELCSRDSSCTALGSPFSCYPPPGDRTANWLHQTSYIHCRRADKPRLGICMWLTKASMAFAGNAIGFNSLVYAWSLNLPIISNQLIGLPDGRLRCAQCAKLLRPPLPCCPPLLIYSTCIPTRCGVNSLAWLPFPLPSTGESGLIAKWGDHPFPTLPCSFKLRTSLQARPPPRTARMPSLPFLNSKPASSTG